MRPELTKLQWGLDKKNLLNQFHFQHGLFLKIWKTGINFESVCGLVEQCRTPVR